MKAKLFFNTLLCFFNIMTYAAALSTESPLIPNCGDLSLDEKIGQLIMMASVSAPEINTDFMAAGPYVLDPSNTERMIREYNVGGVIFLGAGTPEAQARETERLQKASKHPLLIGLDAEWGLSMRHGENAIAFPRAMVLGAFASEDDDLIYELGEEIGRQCTALGTHINFAPVVDVNNNPHNPIINTRSFGENPKKVAQKAALFIRGMQSAGVLACAKHFPGHGDTAVDSHHSRGCVPHSQERLHDVELVPFQRAIDEGVSCVMTAHLDVPALSGGEQVPATLSHDIITSLLRDKLQFKGLVITDGLGMKGVTDFCEPGELELQALMAGNDILLCPADVPRAIQRIKRAVLEGEVSEKEIDRHVERILDAKRKVIRPALPFNMGQIFSPFAKNLKKRLYQAAVTVARDAGALPLVSGKKVIIKTFGKCNDFVRVFGKWGDIEHVASELTASEAELDVHDFDDTEQIVVSLHMEGRSGMIEMQAAESSSTPPAYVSFIKKYAKKIVLALFGNPYNLEHFSDVPTVVVGYENEPEAQRAVAKVLLGKNAAKGTLPVTPIDASGSN